MVWKCDYLKWAMRYYGKATYDLATSGVPTPSPRVGPTVTAPDDPTGYERLREAIAAHHGVPVDEVLPALGASQGMWLAYAGMVGPGDEVLVEEPAYEPLGIAAVSVGAAVRRFHRDPANGCELDADQVMAAITPRTNVVAVTNLHNPSGSRSSDEALRTIAERLEAQSGHLFVDEIYAPLDHMGGEDGSFRQSARHLAPNIVTTGSLTKAYGLGPRRVGWVLGPTGVIDRARDATIVTIGGLPHPWANDAADAFAEVPQLASRTRGMLGDKRRRVEEWIAERPSLTWTSPQEGLFGLVMTSSETDLRPAIEAGVERHDVIVVPGSFFGMPNAFRIAWALPEELLDEGLRRLDLVLDEV